ncbi:MAG: heavy metal translocating P-type ATPase [Spirochaetaceae bacterium]|jgi:Cd2+/Zn2+-exporting ATPase|nr:heavy metal translocating P-type ATPase [Spirochaetaceae bacterium]
MNTQHHGKAAGCSLGCCGDNSAKKEAGGNRTLYIVRMAFGILLFMTGLVLRKTGFSLGQGAEGAVVLGCFLVSWLSIGGDVLLRSAKNIGHGSIFDENFLMSIATIGAFAIGEYPEAVAVMLFYQVGEFFQESAINKSRRSIRALLDIRPSTANLKKDGEIIVVPPAAVNVGDVIIVKCGERCPLDGIVLEGNSVLDMSALTGESMPVETGPGAAILSGAINKTALLTVQVSKEEGDSAISRILAMVENAREKKAEAENFITGFARYYTPAVVFAALILALLPPFILDPPLFAGGAISLPAASLFGDWVYRALVFLVVSCPCALVISVPLSFFAGLGCASRAGILIKGGNFIEALAQAGTVVFDKTGTLTKGAFRVTAVECAAGFSEEELLLYTANAEAFSTHPAAISICKRAGGRIDKNSASNVREIAGQGVGATVRGKEVLAGSLRLMQNNGLCAGGQADGGTAGTVVYTAIDGVYAGRFVIADEIKPDSERACRELHELGVQKIAMLTGDGAGASAVVAKTLGIDDVRSNLLPEDKLTELEKLYAEKAAGTTLLFAGDGINDAPVLARADAGIAMGALGSDAAIEAADIVLMTDEPSRIAKAIRISRKTRRIVIQNIVFALSVKGVILAAGALGFASIWMAVFGDVGVALLAVLNAMRAMKEPRA